MKLKFNKYTIISSQYASNKYDLLENTGRLDKDGKEVCSPISYGMTFDHVVKKIARGELTDVNFDGISEMFLTFENKINEIIDEFKRNLK